jgi:hypothetical protein
MNLTLVAQDLFKSESGKGTQLSTETTKAERRQQDNKKKITCFMGTGGYCFTSQDNYDWIQTSD